MKTRFSILLLLMTPLVLVAGSELVPVFQDNTYQFTGVAVSKQSRMFANYPRWQPPHEYDVVEVSSNGMVQPYPNGDWNNWQQKESGTNKWVCVQAVYVDDDDQLWVVDPAAPEMKRVQGDGAKLVSIDLRNDQVTHIFNLTKLVGKDSYLNDVRVDTKSKTAYLTESKNGGIMVVDISSGQSRLLLKGHRSVKADPNHQVMIDGQVLMRNGKPFKGNSDGIALSPDRQWLYYKALSDTKLYRVPTEALRNAALSKSELESKVEDLGSNFSTSDGMIFDPKGGLYLSDAEHDSIVRVEPDLKCHVIIHDERLIWPDTFSFASDGWLFITCSQIQTMPWSHDGKSTRTTPYAIYKFRIE
jgi:sugar lactone lactonase YvrE